MPKTKTHQGTAASIFRTNGPRFLAAILIIAAVTAIFAPFRHGLNQTTVAMAFLLAVLSIAMLWGIWPSWIAAVLGMLCFNFFFLSPVYKLTISNPQNLVAVAAFFITASAVGHLSARARLRAAQAEASAEETRRLNADLEQRVAARTAQLQAANDELEQAHERETEIGFRIQQNLLLDDPPGDVPGLRTAALFIPTQRIGGDFYIFIRHSNECLDVIVGDVMGKGIPAALLGAATKSRFLKVFGDLMIVARVAKNGKLPEPREIVMLAHAGLVRHLIDLDSFVTLCYARFDVARRRLDLVDCGHTGVIQFRNETGLCEMLHGDNLPLGVREGEIYDQISVPFGRGDLLFFFSDGITEAQNCAGEFFGADRLQECVRINAQLDPASLVEAVRKAVFTFHKPGGLADDLTSVAIRVEEHQPPSSRAELEIGSDLTELRRARTFVREVCRGLLDEDAASALELAVNEAASNVMKHAYHGRADQSIHLEAETFPDHVSIRLYHFGDPFDPSTVPAPPFDGSRESGFGLHIISSSVDEVRYYRDEHGRNCISRVKTRKLTA